VRIGEQYRPTRDLDLLGMGEATEAAIDTAVREIAATKVDDDGLVLAYPTETIIAEKTEAMVDLGISNSRMKDFTDIAMAARRVTFDGDVLVAALRATFRRWRTPLPDAEIVGLSDRFVQDASAQANWKAFATRNRPRDFESLIQV